MSAMTARGKGVSVVMLFSVLVPCAGTPKTDRVGRACPADMGEGWFDGLTNHGCHVR